MKTEWLLEPGVTYLNHGSFGACPRLLLEKQREYQERLERQPVRFMLSEVPELLKRSREAMAGFVGCDADDLVFLSNATSAVNTVLRSLNWKPGDQLLTTNHAYNACANALHYVADRYGAEVIVADIPFPMQDPQEAIDAIMSCVTPSTRLALLDHITSPTGMVLPIGAIIQSLHEQGVDSLIDGAHAPGMLPLDLDKLGAAYFTGNCHKWMCTPKGVAFLYVRRDKQEAIRPLVISHGANEPLQGVSRFQIEFSWLGTDDPSGRLCVPDAIAWGEQAIEGGWPALMKRNRDLVLQARRLLCDSLGVEAPIPDEMIGMIAAIPLPATTAQDNGSAFAVDPLEAALLTQYNIEVPIFLWPSHPRRWLRVSAQLYNQLSDYEQLAEALNALIEY